MSIGAGAALETKARIAELGKGDYIRTEGSIDQYSSQLEAIFRTLGGKRPVEIIR